MLLADLGGDEDGGADVLEATGVGEELAQVVVVGALQLVLDDDAVLVAEGAADDVGLEAADGGLDAFDGELKAEGVAEEGDVGLLRQPGVKSAASSGQ